MLCPCWKPAAKVADGAGGSKTHAPELFLHLCRSNCRVYWGFHSIKLLHYKQSNVAIVNRHSNGFIGPHVIHKHTNTHTHFTHVRFAWQYILTYMHSKVYLNCNEFVPLG